MQHTLIPYKDRQRLHHEYYVRTIIIFLSILSIAVVLSSAALIPSYLRAWLASRNAESAILAARSLKADPGVNDAKAELDKNNLLVTEVTQDLDETNFAGRIRSLIDARQGVVLSSVSMSKVDAKTIHVNLAGSAPTRDDLLAFKSRLEMMLPGTKIDIPIDQLAKTTNLQFLFQFDEHLQ